MELDHLGVGRGFSPQILVGMCRGKGKHGRGLRNELPVERENQGLRYCQDVWRWRAGRLLTRGAISGTAKSAKKCKMVMLRNGLKKLWSPEWQYPPKNVKWCCSETDLREICENYMLRNGNSGGGGDWAAHTKYAYIWK